MAGRLAAVGRALDAFLARPGSDPWPHRDVWEPLLSGGLPEEGAGADETLRRLVEEVVPHGGRYSDPGFWGWITVGPTTLPVAAAAAASVAGPQRYGLTAFSLLERTALRWLADLCGLPGHMEGVFTSGGSTANLLALGAARQWALERQGIDPAADGLDGRRLAVYASTQVHHTVQRACAVLGMGRSAVRPVAVGDDGRMIPEALDAALATGHRDGRLPVAVVASAGTTDTGAIDPLRAIGTRAHAAGAWFHVDGAYGLPGILDPRVAPLYDGLGLADSAIVDPHKWLGATVGVGAAYVRDPGLLVRAFTQEPADYLDSAFDTGPPQVSLDALGNDYADMGVELSSPSRGVIVWAILTELGREGMRRRIVADRDLALRVADLVRAHPRLDLLQEPTLSVVCFRYRGSADPDAVNRAIVRDLLRTTPWVATSTTVDGAYAIRPCFVNARTRREDVDAFVDAVAALGDRLDA